MKYLWLIFLLTSCGLLAVVRFSDPPENPYADGHLACAPLPPAAERPARVLLPPPILERIPPPVLPAHVQATSIEIFSTSNAGSGLMVETRQEDNLDWGLPRSLPTGGPASPISYAIEARVVEPVPVNVPPPPPPELVDFLTSNTTQWSPMLAGWQSDTQVYALSRKLAYAVERGHILEPPPKEGVPDDSRIETASIAPAAIIPPRRATVPNLYLPDGATDEAGARLTLIRPSLYAYELPDDSSTAAPFQLRAGDQVRPLTRLRNTQGYDWIKFEHEDKSWWAKAEYFIRVDPTNLLNAEGNLAVGKEKVDKDSALPMDYKPSDLAEIPDRFTFGARNIMMRKEAVEAFVEMAEAAEKEGLAIRVFSGFRDFDYQKNLYLKAVEQSGPKQDGTAAPGYSEHQLGTTCDISGNDRRTILSGTFGETPEGRWLTENSEKFGFRKSYTQENTEQVGYKPEPWHFRYVGKPAQGKAVAKAGKAEKK